MASRLWPRLWIIARAAPSMLLGKRKRPVFVRRILVVHHLLLGDTIMLAPLLKRLRLRYPDADIIMLCNPAYVPLFHKRPYGVTAMPYDPRSISNHFGLANQAAFDIAFVPGDNRWSWLARALKSRWVVAFASDRRTYKDWPIDEFVSFPSVTHTWGDIAARLCDDTSPGQYTMGEWLQPDFAPFAEPSGAYCVLHLGASSPHKLWSSDKWSRLIDWVENQSMQAVLTSGRGEEKLIAEVDPKAVRRHYPGTLDLVQMWQLLRGAEFLVCPDTGIAHLARIVGTPTVALFGPGSPEVSGPGEFWRASSFACVTINDIPCRDQDLLFERKLAWVRHCWRTPQECGNPICIQSITFNSVSDALTNLGVAHLRRPENTA